MIKHVLELAGVAHLPKSKLLIEQALLVEGFKEAQTEFAQASSEQEAQERIAQFRDLVNRNQVQGNERNIDFWRKQGWEKFSSFVSIKSQTKSVTQEKRAKVPGKSITIHEDSNWLIVVPLDKDASCFHGKNTDWCTTKPYASYFESYFYDSEVTLIYFLHLGTGDKWAIACTDKLGETELFDKHDTKIDDATFKQQTGFDPVEYRNRVLGSQDVQKQTAQSRQLYREALARIKAKRPFTEVDSQLEADLLFTKDIETIVEYCKAVKGRWRQVEKLIAGSDHIGSYVNTVLGGKRLPEIEKLIRTAAGVFSYVDEVIHHRWPQGEQFLLSDPDLTLEYAKEYAVEYDDDTGTAYFDMPGAEEAIAKGAAAAVYYARYFLRCSWPEAEPVIIKNPISAAEYAMTVLKRRWPEAEATISRNQYMWDKYKKFYGISN